MEIKRLKDNQIRCAITEEEIEGMGFSIEDIIGNGETTQKFMSVVLERIEQEEQIDTTLLSPMVRAELMPDHSMTITFGGITEEEKKGMFGKILEMMEKLKENPDEISTKSKKKRVKEKDDIFIEITKLGLEFSKIEDVVNVSKLLAEKVTKSSLYKMNGNYYLFVDFKGFLNQEIKSMICMALEYAKECIVEPSVIAYIKEHGKCIMKKDAVWGLGQL